jgi:divalent metal cation (Fe/Co/Zn/Cd) transporter
MRAFNRIAALALSLVLIAGGVFVVVESVLAALHRRPWLLPSRRWYEALRGTQLSDRSMTVVAVTVGLVGLVLLVAEIRPWAPYRLPAQLSTADPDTEWWVLRGPAERRLAKAVAGVSGVNAARVRLRGRHQWTVRVRAEARDESRDRITAAIDGELARLAAPGPARVRLRLRKPRRVT